MKFLLGIDVGSSSVKCALIEIDSGACVASAYAPSSEMQIHAPQSGFAEQDPDTWWTELRNAMSMLADEYDYKKNDIAAIGISYQMHGLVMVDKDGHPLRPSIIWCDSRAVEIGNHAFQQVLNFITYPVSDHEDYQGKFQSLELADAHGLQGTQKKINAD